MDYKQLLVRSYKIATNSYDSSTQNGAIIVNEEGHEFCSAFNTFAKGVKKTEERINTRPLKYMYFVHAESGVIYAAAKKGICTKGLTLVCGWAACSKCAVAIIESGIKRLVRHKQASDRSPQSWMEEIVVADQMLQEAGIEIVDYDGVVDGTLELRHSGQIWKP